MYYQTVQIEVPSSNLDQAIQSKIDLKTKPVGSLGILERTVFKICRIQNTLNPSLLQPAVLICAADHGVVAEGVSPYPQEVTWQMIMNFTGGGAAINVFTSQHGMKLLVADAGVNFDFSPSTPILHRKVRKGTRNFVVEPAMTPQECDQAMRHGAEMVRQLHREGCNTIIFGEMGIGNTTAATALFCQYSGIAPREVTGAGTGLTEEGVRHKIEVISRALARHSEYTDPFDILCAMGGLEIAMIAGGMLEAAHHKMVILVDGFIVTSALLAAHALNANILEYCLFTHQSNERGHRAMIQYLQGEPMLDLGMRLGEGTGAAVAYPIVVSAVRFMNQMSSFDEAGVSK